MPDLQALLQQAQQMQSDMAAAQEDLAAAEFTGHAGGGLVSATVSGQGQLLSLVIDPSVVDPAEVETLADLVIAAVRDATRAAAEIAEQQMSSWAGSGAGLDLSAFGLPPVDGLPDASNEYDDDDDDHAKFSHLVQPATPPVGA